MSVRTEFGPSLPALLEARGLSRRAVKIAAAVLVVAIAATWLGLRAARDSEQLVVAGPPAFNLVYAPSVLHTAGPHAGELARIEGATRGQRVAITVSALHVPASVHGDIVGGYLPVLAEHRLVQLRAQLGPIGVFDEGKARINLFPGYQIGFSAGAGKRRTLGRDVFLLPDEGDAHEGVLLSVRREVVSGRGRPDDAFLQAVKDAFASFAFGSDRP